MNTPMFAETLRDQTLKNCEAQLAAGIREAAQRVTELVIAETIRRIHVVMTRSSIADCVETRFVVDFKFDKKEVEVVG